MNEMTIDNLKGLTSDQVLEQRAAHGANQLPAQEKRTGFAILMEVIKEPMFLLLMACGILYLFSGDFGEALMLLGFVFVIIGITFYQEKKTERALEALRDLSSPRACVIRNGEKMRIPGQEVVKGDLVLLEEGDRVPADALLIHALNFTVDESLLTGESLAVGKSFTADASLSMDRPGGEDTPFVFSGTLVVSGQAIGIIQAVGARTELGKIGKALESLEEEKTPLQTQTAALVRFFALFGGALCLLTVGVYWLTRGHLVDGFLAGLSLAMAILPEEFPVVLTVFLALGAWRISGHRVLTRRVPAVETLGSATVLCVDKTGTLTQNRMTVTDIVAKGQVYAVGQESPSLPEAFHEVVEYSILASPADPFDPMEKAMKALGEQTLKETEHLHASWKLQREYPLSRDLPAMSRVWFSPSGDDLVIAAKGAPEAIADLCHFNGNQLRELEIQIDALSCQGKRIIGVAGCRHQKKRLPEEQHDFQFEFIGLLGLEDPIRPDVPGAIEECYRAGIRTLMITGDYPGTAMSIARQIRLQNPDQCLTGQEMTALTDQDLAEKIRTINVFARMIPEQKLRIVQALKANQEIVAMTGDGVNDAPALKAAHIGVAMGGRGTDVAREAASLVLLDDDFSSIVAAVRMGRRIYDNLKKAMMYILSVHIPIAGLSLIPVLMKWPLILYPVHIVFLELIIDPACTLVFEADKDEPGIMLRPPRSLGERLFDRTALVRCLFQGGITLAVTLGVSQVICQDHSPETARALTFLTLVICNLGMILTNRSLNHSGLGMLKKKNAAFKWVMTGTISVMALILTLPGLQRLYRFDPVPLEDFFLALGGGCLAVGLMELMKLRSLIRSRNKV